MSLPRKHLAALLVASTLACIDQPTEPGAPTGALQIRPVLPAGSSMASFNLVVDSVFVEIYMYDTTACVECQAVAARPGGAAALATLGRLDTVLVSETFYWDPADETLPLRFELPEIPRNHVVQIYIEVDVGDTPLFSGSYALTEARGTVVLPPIEVFYFGPGSNADSIAMTPGDTSALLLDTLQFSAEAFAGGVLLDTVYLGWRTTDSTKARISYTGQLTFRPAMAGSTVGVIAMVPNGVADTVTVTVPQPAASIVRVSGDSQIAPALEALGAPLVVRVRDAGNQPERGILVRFAPLGATGTTVTDSLVFTDSLGLAATTVLLGAQAGGVDIEAVVVANTAIKVAFHATIDPPVPVPIIWVSDSFGVTGALRRVDPDGNNRATILPIASAGIQQALPRWAPGRQRAAFSTGVGSFTGLVLVNRAGDSSATYVDDESAFRPRFSPDGTHIAFQCGSIQDDEQTGQVCVGGGVAGELTTLGGAGNSGLRVLLTDKVPNRTDGPASYAWNPVSPTELAIVRDSVADTTRVVHSAVYRIDATGTGLTLLSAPSIDLGKGPLKIVGPMDWSPDGKTIVFSAREPAVNESNLYLLDVGTGAVTQLTTAPAGSFGDNGDRLPVFSPDGSEVLFLRIDHSGDGMGADYNVVAIADGTVRQVGYEGSNWATSSPYALGADWSPDSQTLLLPGAINFFAGLFLVPSDISSQAEYLAGRVLIGDGDGSNNKSDQVGSWRP